MRTATKQNSVRQNKAPNGKNEKVWSICNSSFKVDKYGVEFANRSTMKEYSMNVSNEGIKQSQNNHNPLENFIFIKKMIN